MNRYSHPQIKSLFENIYSSRTIPFYIVKLFISNDSDFATNTIKVCKDDLELYDHFRNFLHKKIGGNLPNDIQKKIWKDAFDLIFEVSINKVPLYINDPIMKSIVVWRLTNKI
jgi:hypothetical protein